MSVRGIYTYSYAAAYSWDGKNFTRIWKHTSDNPGSGIYSEGAHSVSVGDLDGDGQWDLVGNRSTGALYGYRSLKGSFGDRTPLLPEVGGLGLLA